MKTVVYLGRDLLGCTQREARVFADDEEAPLTITVGTATLERVATVPSLQTTRRLFAAGRIPPRQTIDLKHAVDTIAARARRQRNDQESAERAGWAA